MTLRKAHFRKIRTKVGILKTIRVKVVYAVKPSRKRK